jgi:hypothetical protein
LARPFGWRRFVILREHNTKAALDCKPNPGIFPTASRRLDFALFNGSKAEIGDRKGTDTFF